MRTSYRFRNGKWIPAQEAAPPDGKIHVVQDSMSPLMNHADCKVYDSKSRFRAATKAAGCHEVGNDQVNTGPRDPRTREKVRAALLENWERLSSPDQRREYLHKLGINPDGRD